MSIKKVYNLMVSKGVGFYVGNDASECFEDINSYKELMMYLRSPERFFEYLENLPDTDERKQF